MCRNQSTAWVAILRFTTTSACINHWTIERRQSSTGTAKPWQQRPPAVDRLVVLTLGSTLVIRTTKHSTYHQGNPATGIRKPCSYRHSRHASPCRRLGSAGVYPPSLEFVAVREFLLSAPVFVEASFLCRVGDCCPA